MTADPLAVRRLETDDCSWVADLMDERRQHQAPFSPRFWNPAPQAAETHLAFLMWLVMQDDTLALRTDEGFIIGTVQGDRVMVDDFAVTADERWATHGRALLSVLADQSTRATSIDHVRVVSARRDEAKRSMLAAAGLQPASRWWVAELDGAGESQGAPERGQHRIAGHDVSVIDAPPVYDPGGPVAIVDEPAADAIVDLAEGGRRLGASLLIVVTNGEGAEPWEGDAALAAAGLHNPSEFWDGTPS